LRAALTESTDRTTRSALEFAPGPRALDIGAGTGKLAATLVALGTEVIAVEPDPEMLTGLRRALPDVRVLPGGAEAVPLPDSSVDAVLAGNALHWFDMDAAGPEIARVPVHQCDGHPSASKTARGSR
jgi:ubiquinone/menaquinone biosynthesis C-methylase UbiE